MIDPDDDPIGEILARSRERAERFGRSLDQLRSGDPAFAEASGSYPSDMSEWQSAVYCSRLRSSVRRVGRAVLADRSIAPMIDELENPRRGWAASENAVMGWAAHFWDVDRHSARFPCVFESFVFRRWITACHLRRVPPALAIVAGGQR